MVPYSMSLGLTGQRSRPDVVRAERKTIEMALKMGLYPRVELAGHQTCRALSGDGREAFLHWLRRARPVRLVEDEQDRDAGDVGRRRGGAREGGGRHLLGPAVRERSELAAPVSGRSGLSGIGNPHTMP